MPRPRRSIAAFCIAVTAFAAFLPGVWSLDPIWFEPLWVLYPSDAPVAYEHPVTAAGEQPLTLFSLLASRGPPSVLFS